MQKKKKSNSSNILVYIAIFLASIAVIVISFAAGYYFGFDEKSDETLKSEISTLPKPQEQTQTYQEPEPTKPFEENQTEIAKPSNINISEQNITEPKIDTKPETAPPKESKKAKTKEAQKYENASHEIEDKEVITPPKRKKQEQPSGAKGKLAIIIDDVSTSEHVKNIKNSGLVLTMSFLPPNDARPDSARLAAKESFYMVHLPLEAKNFSKEEPQTLRVDDSQEEISQRVKEIKSAFPSVKYINNHTGSKFTSNLEAVEKLIIAMNEQNINFVDSRTIGSTKVEPIMKKYHKRYIARDIFLDHEMDKASVRHQLKEAIRIAKEHGSAIAIGHPHPNTLAVLRESADLLQEVELVQINKL